MKSTRVVQHCIKHTVEMRLLSGFYSINSQIEYLGWEEQKEFRAIQQRYHFWSTYAQYSKQHLGDWSSLFSHSCSD